jgi:hypothetical protein
MVEEMFSVRSVAGLHKDDLWFRQFWAQCPVAELGHGVSGMYKYWDLTL